MAAPVIPPNLSAETAIEVTSLPYSITQDVNFGGTTHTVWYKYTAKPYLYNLHVSSLGDASNYFPICDIYTGTPATYVRTLVNNGVAQMPVTAGTTYFLLFRSATGNRSDPCILTFKLTEGPNEMLPKGSVLVNEDSAGSIYPGAIMSNTTGEVLGFRNGIQAGENGDALLDGTIGLTTEYEDIEGLAIYNPDLTLRVHVPIEVSRVGSDHNNTFYVASDGLAGTPGTPAVITAISKTGTVINSWTVPLVVSNNKFITNITGSTDGRYVYFQNPYPDNQIRKLDTTNGTFSIFSSTVPPGSTGVALYRTMFAIEGTSSGRAVGEDVLIHLWNITSGYEIIEYDSLGVPTVVRSYVNITDGDGNRLLRSYTSDNITLWTDAPDAEMGPPCYEYKMRWRRVSIDTGDDIADYRSAVYWGGSADVNDGCESFRDFGHAGSCPGVTTTVDVPALPKSDPPNYSGIYQVKRGKTNDTVYTAISPQTTEVVKIPDPFIKTSMLGS